MKIAFIMNIKENKKCEYYIIGKVVFNDSLIKYNFWNIVFLTNYFSYKDFKTQY